MSVCSRAHLELAARDAGDVEQVVDQHQLGSHVAPDQLDRAAQRRRQLAVCARARAAPSRPASAACAARARGWPGSGPWRGSRPRPRRAPCGCRPAPAPARRGWSRAPARRRAPAVWSRKILSRPIGWPPSPSRIAIITPLPQKRRAVLAPVPALVGGAAFGERLRRLALRRAGDAVLLDEDDVGASRPIDLVGDIAGQALGADVPAGDAPLQVHGEDRVLARVVDDQAQPLLGLAQRLLGVAPVA